jgi:hypothetical protein
MKHFALAVLLVLILTSNFAQPTFAQEEGEIRVLIDGLPVQFDVQPLSKMAELWCPFERLPTP